MLDHVLKSMISFIRNCQALFQSVGTTYIRTSIESPYCSSSPAFGGVSVLGFGQSSRCAVILQCFISNFLVMYDAGLFFLCAFLPSVYHLGLFKN